MIKLIINSHKIPINEKLTFLQGNYNINEIENLPYSWVEWDKYLDNIFSDSNLMIDFLSNLNFMITQQNSKKSSLLSENWNELYGIFKDNKDNISEYKKFNHFKLNLENKSNLLQEIERLELKEKKIDQLADESIFQGKKDLLRKLEKLLETHTTEFTIQSDEYFANKQRVDEYLEIKAKYDENLSQIKYEQRILFKETNELTKQMDDLEPLLETYQDKLEVLDPKKNKEDFKRIQKKCDDIKSVHKDLKSDRILKIKNSKDINQKMRNLRNQIKKNNNNLKKQNISKFQEIKKKYDYLNTELENTKAQIKSVRLEINSMLSKNEKINPQSDINQEEQFYSSPNEIKEVLKKKRNNINQIDNIFENSYETTDLDIINKKFKKNRMKISEKLSQNSEKLKHISEETHNFEEFIERTKNIQSWMNKILSKIDMKLSFSLAFDKENLKLTNKVMRKNQIINIDTDLKRVEKAFFYFSYIISSYLGGNYKFIPIRIENLPKFMITKGNFIKNIKMLEDICDELPEDISIIFLIEENNYEIPLKIIRVD
ncbi:MAG: hypothetical protein ACTSRX_05630 [Promethearchaeota archaeon]